MNKITSNVLFAVLLTVVMNGLDIVYHLATRWAVHLNYVAVKLTVVFLATFLIVQFAGKGREQGVVTSIIGPFMFYIYYLSANPTINRELFKIDEQFWFFFLHFAFMMIAYFSAMQFVQASGWRKHAGFVIASAIGATALDAIFIMARLKALGFDEEAEARFLTLSVIAVPLLSYLVSVAVLRLWSNERWGARCVTALLAGILVALLTRDMLHAFFAAAALLVVYWLVFEVHFEQMISQGLSRKGWILLGAGTLLIGGFYQFLPRKTVKSIAEFFIFDVTLFGYKIRQNDIILVSTLLLVICLVSFYQVYRLYRAQAKSHYA